MEQEKQALREKILASRNQLSLKERGEKSKLIKERLFSLPEFKQAQIIMFYVSFGSEVQTGAMISQALEFGKRVVAPVVKEGELRPAVVEDLSQLKPGFAGILEPAPAPSVTPEQIGLAVLPGVAFDLQGYRIGYGAGYYDRFLSSSVNLRLTTIGLAYEIQIVDKIPRASHDIAVDKIITEKRIIKSQP